MLKRKSLFRNEHIWRKLRDGKETVYTFQTGRNDDENDDVAITVLIIIEFVEWNNTMKKN